MKNVLFYNFSYVRTEPYKKRPYPEEGFRNLKKNKNAELRLEQIAGITGNAKRFFRSVLNSGEVDKKVIIQYYADMLRLSNIVEEFLLLYNIEVDFQQLKSIDKKMNKLVPLEKIRKNLNKIFSLQMEALKIWEEIKPTYLHPHGLRNMSFMLKFCEEALNKVDEIEFNIKSDTLDKIPASLIIGTYKEL